jgi:exosortase family protein XrtF
MIGQYKPALIFIIKYLVLYFFLNTIYAFYINAYSPATDPLTISITRQVAALLRWAGEPVAVVLKENYAQVPIQRDGNNIVEVYEGCNSVNVMIVYFSFLIAFSGPWKALMKFSFLGFGVIYLMNLVRVSVLYLVSLHYPDKLYFFHKFFFTGIIYGVVFILWFIWMNSIKQWSKQKKM